MQSIWAKEFFDLSANHPVIDVRTPAEFEHGHIPGAVNIPLFSNEERAEIGILYKQKDREAAINKGWEIVKPKMKLPALLPDGEAGLPGISSIWESPYKGEVSGVGGRTLLVHCWRGGMRSAGMAMLFEWWGYKVFTLKGGYKSFRRMVLNSFTEKRKINVLGGRTGSGKTVILEELGKLGETIVDLEKLACHKGSAFGTLGEKPQPTQEMFENEVAVQLMKIPDDVPFWVEDESQNIGKRIIPNPFFDQMRSAKVCFVDLPLEERLEYLTREYGKFPKEELVASIEKIWKRVGPQHAKAAIAAIENGDIRRACEICLVYYDKSYAHGIAKRTASSVVRKPFGRLEPEKIAREIVRSFR